MYISVLLTLCLLLIKEVLFTYAGQCIFNDMFNDRMVFILKCLTYSILMVKLWLVCMPCRLVVLK